MKTDHFGFQFAVFGLLIKILSNDYTGTTLYKLSHISEFCMWVSLGFYAGNLLGDCMLMYRKWKQ